MDRHRVSRLAHRDHPIAAPLNDEAVDEVLRHALVPEEELHLLDLGCGGGEWILRALERSGSASAVGVDVSEPALAHATAQAQRRGVAERLVLEREDAGQLASGGSYDVVFAVGVSHVFGGLAPTLEVAAEHLAPGGRLVIGDGFWAAPPSPEAVEMLGPLLDLAGSMAVVTGAGWTPAHGHISTRAELDAYEWAWTGSLAGWALDQPPGSPDAADALAVAQGHLEEWLRDYRDTFGFLTLVLRRPPSALLPPA
ncbi:class I SAM-dependent methyltransferase [Kineosporia sp. NBRC 101731]|uniref:SAM-dependent methyltransferase n=1 Tax=Kineosporia sp. NBRC 101731 TaxID=3032199 RepID=UPI0024A24100|nr:class I SAM-dependent methyltransferase [Kineosporia sp. NBRC 101731]GLY31974.1 SAM-dependent methyltransferase [Kineosporia sp. NBRC 101731]